MNRFPPLTSALLVMSLLSAWFPSNAQPREPGITLPNAPFPDDQRKPFVIEGRGEGYQLSDHLGARLTSLSTNVRSIRYLDKPGRVETIVRCNGQFVAKSMNLRLIHMSTPWRVTKVVDAQGTVVPLLGLDKQRMAVREYFAARPPLVTLSQLAGNDRGYIVPALATGFRPTARCGPVLAEVVAQSNAYVADEVATIDWALPEEEIREHGDPTEGQAATRTVELFDGAMLTMTRYGKYSPAMVRDDRRAVNKLKFTLRTKTVEPFMRSIPWERAKPIAHSCLAVVTVKDGQPMRLLTLNVQHRLKRSTDDDPRFEAEHELEIPMKPDAPDGLRFYIASNIQQIPVVATLHDVDLHATVHPGIVAAPADIKP
jgi:hypothetical protein